MAKYKTELHGPIGTTPFLITFTQAAPPKGVALVAEELATGAVKINAIYVDNTANANFSYLKLWDSNPTLGTTRAEFIIPVQPSTKLQFSFDPSLESTNLWGAVLSSPDNTATTSPTGQVVTRLLLGT